MVAFVSDECFRHIFLFILTKESLFYFMACHSFILYLAFLFISTNCNCTTKENQIHRHLVARQTLSIHACGMGMEVFCI